MRDLRRDSSACMRKILKHTELRISIRLIVLRGQICARMCTVHHSVMKQASIYILFYQNFTSTFVCYTSNEQRFCTIAFLSFLYSISNITMGTSRHSTNAKKETRMKFIIKNESSKEEKKKLNERQ